ncbi:hypothetical protein BT96DRAFT_1027167 [Gymnopus androsaceus JB14]|uniref:Uncharacterized protein n=1 Tax=Gymnopus androsaceus JB14 TaxID=1447944 RepID=A0A6A4GDP2_9AGAR|nr:hypothetical protein BT96DRAFT_1027167 [Gymnopus androsaceus JB14]
MGIDAGFDFFPPIKANDPDAQSEWENFLNAVGKEYKDDPNVKTRKNGDIAFDQGEGPFLPKEGHKFRRFSSKVSGSHAGNVETYLKRVCALARAWFGDGRVYWWSEYGYEGEPSAIYGWDEVYKARNWPQELFGQT